MNDTQRVILNELAAHADPFRFRTPLDVALGLEKAGWPATSGGCARSLRKMLESGLVEQREVGEVAARD